MRPEDCQSIHTGETKTRGLHAPARITRDRWGIPHIRAANLHDAFFAQGFCMAQDRGWQIELIRHMAHGRAASLINKGLLGLDIQNRKLGFGRLAAAELPHLSAEARAVLDAYADGINAAIQTQPAPFEFQTLGHTMQPWSAVDSLAIVKLVNSGQQWATKLKYGQVAAQLGPDAVTALVPEVPPGAALIVPSGARWTGQLHPFAEDITRAMGEPDGTVAAGGGSNCWVVHGSRTASGAPLVAGDPHLPVTLPGQWYVVHMECPEFTAAGPCNPGYPGPMFYGHNTKVAWTMTHAQGDRWDDYRERIRQGASGPEYLYCGAWGPLERRDERFEVRGGEAVTATIWSTRHGPVIFGDPLHDDEVITARWGLAEPAHDFDAMLGVLRSSSASEARASFRRYDSVSGNFCFADTAGDIGYQYAGRIPRRPPWLVPVPGWTGDHEWDGSIPKDELPCEDNPASGYVMTANNRTVGPNYPHYLSYAVSRFRADRLRELIEATPVFAVDDMRRFQADQTSVMARDLARLLAAAPAPTEAARRLQTLFHGWDGTLSAESPAAVALDFVCEALAKRTVTAYLATAPTPPDLLAMETRRVLYEQAKAGSSLMLVSDASWTEAIGHALEAAAAVLRERFGADPAAWRWDAAHSIQWRHNLGRDGELAELLNVPPVPIGGDATTPFATSAGYDRTVSSGVSYRQVFDLSDLNAALICIPPGNSGQPGSPHYADNVQRWRDVEYHPLYIDWADIAANAEADLTLVP